MELRVTLSHACIVCLVDVQSVEEVTAVAACARWPEAFNCHQDSNQLCSDYVSLQVDRDNRMSP
jgi:hypothetical protein